MQRSSTIGPVHKDLARWGLVALVAIAVPAIAIGLTMSRSGDDKAPATADALATNPTTTDPYAVPDVIDVAYVQRILDHHMQVYGEVRRDVVDNHRFTEESKAKITAIYGGDLREQKVFDFSGLSGRTSQILKPESIAPHVTIQQVPNSRLDCIYVVGTVNDDSSRRNPAGDIPTAWALRRSEVQVNRSINNTGWQFVTDVPLAAPSIFNPCVD